MSIIIRQITLLLLLLLLLLLYATQIIEICHTIKRFEQFSAMRLGIPNFRLP